MGKSRSHADSMDKAKARGFSFYAQQQDWFLWLLIVLAAVATYLVDKYQQLHYIRKFVTTDSTIAYKHNEDTIAFWLAPLIPAIVFIIHMVYWELTKTHLPWGHRFASIFRFFTSCLAALAVVGFHTELFKTLCGRLRPDFLDRCYGKDMILQNGTISIEPNTDCKRNGLEDDGRKSFPSGHSSCTLAISLYAAYYVLWCLHFRVGKAGNKGYHNKAYVPGTSCGKRFGTELLSFMDLLLMLFQLAWAWGVGVSRFRDNRHHASDIIAGFVLAFTFTPLFLLRTISQQAYWDKYIIDADHKEEGDRLPVHTNGGPAQKDPSIIDVETPIPKHHHNYSEGHSMGGNTPTGPTNTTGFSQFGKPAPPQQQQPTTSPAPMQHHHQQQHSNEQLPLPPPVQQASWSVVPGSVPSPENRHHHHHHHHQQQQQQESCFASTGPQVNGNLSVTDSTAPLVPSGVQSSDSLVPPASAVAHVAGESTVPAAGAVALAAEDGTGSGALANTTDKPTSGGGVKTGGGMLSALTQHMSWAKPEKKEVEKVASV